MQLPSSAKIAPPPPPTQPAAPPQSLSSSLAGFKLGRPACYRKGGTSTLLFIHIFFKFGFVLGRIWEPLQEAQRPESVSRDLGVRRTQRGWRWRSAAAPPAGSTQIVPQLFPHKETSFSTRFVVFIVQRSTFMYAGVRLCAAREADCLQNLSFFSKVVKAWWVLWVQMWCCCTGKQVIY